jgi:hypothetical protein
VIPAAATLLCALTWLWPPSLRGGTSGEYRHLLIAVLGEAWERGGSLAMAARWLHEAGDLLVVAVQARPVRARAAVALAAGAVVVTAVLPMIGMPAEQLVVNAVDPAGEFTLTFRRGTVVSATVDGRPYAGDHLVQTRDSVRVVDAAGRILVAVSFEPAGTVRWAARAPAQP